MRTNSTGARGASLHATRRVSRAAGLAALAALTVTGCAGRGADADTLPVVTTDDPEAEAELRLARAADEAGDAEDAAARYERFLQEHADDPLAPLAQLGLGRIRLAEGRLPEAKQLFDAVEAHADESVAERGRFYNGVVLHLDGHHRESIEVLGGFVGRTIEPGETALLLRTIAAAYDRLGDSLGTLEALDRLVREAVPDEDRDEARVRIREVTAGEATADEVRTWYDRLPRAGEAWPLVARRALREAFERGEMSRVIAIVGAIRERGGSLDDDLTAMAVRAERTGRADPRVIGAILPLSGRAREVGQLALRGLVLGAGTPPVGPFDEQAPQLVFRDDGGDPERAARAVDDLVSLHRVIAIIGPVDGATAAAAARRAQSLGVPIVTLTPAGDVTDAGPMVFRLFGTPDGEAQALLRAAQATGATRFAVLHPQSGYGTAMRDAFARQADAAGATVVATVEYDAGATAFGPQIAELERHAFDALFVPDAARTLSLVAPALAAAGVTGADGRAGARVLAPSVGWDDGLPRRAGRYLQGAMFSRPFHPDPTADREDFVRRFRDRYTAEPDLYAAYAYDAFRLVRQAVLGGAQTRPDLAERLVGFRGEGTVGASSGFGPRREAAVATRVLALRDDRLAPP